MISWNALILHCVICIPECCKNIHLPVLQDVHAHVQENVEPSMSLMGGMTEVLLVAEPNRMHEWAKTKMVFRSQQPINNRRNPFSQIRRV